MHLWAHDPRSAQDGSTSSEKCSPALTYPLNIFLTSQTTCRTACQVPASSWSSCKSNHSVWETLQWKYSVKRLPPHKIPFQMTHTPFSQFTPSDWYNFSCRIYINFIYLKYRVAMSDASQDSISNDAYHIFSILTSELVQFLLKDFHTIILGFLVENHRHKSRSKSLSVRRGCQILS